MKKERETYEKKKKEESKKRKKETENFTHDASVFLSKFESRLDSLSVVVSPARRTEGENEDLLRKKETKKSFFLFAIVFFFFLSLEKKSSAFHFPKFFSACEAALAPA